MRRLCPETARLDGLYNFILDSTTAGAILLERKDGLMVKAQDSALGDRGSILSGAMLFS